MFFKNKIEQYLLKLPYHFLEQEPTTLHCKCKTSPALRVWSSMNIKTLSPFLLQVLELLPSILCELYFLRSKRGSCGFVILSVCPHPILSQTIQNGTKPISACLTFFCLCVVKVIRRVCVVSECPLTLSLIAQDSLTRYLLQPG